MKVSSRRGKAPGRESADVRRTWSRGPGLVVRVPRDVEGLVKGSARRARAAKERERVFAPGPARHSRRGRRGVARAASAERGRALPAPLHRTRAARLPAAGQRCVAWRAATGSPPREDSQLRGAGEGAARTLPPAWRPRGGRPSPGELTPHPGAPEQPLLCTSARPQTRIDGGRRGSLAGRCERSGCGRAVPARQRPRAAHRQMAARPSPRPPRPFLRQRLQPPGTMSFFYE